LIGSGLRSLLIPSRRLVITTSQEELYFGTVKGMYMHSSRQSNVFDDPFPMIVLTGSLSEFHVKMAQFEADSTHTLNPEHLYVAKT
jgi:hypothetical protein